MGSLGMQEIIVIFIIALIVFGPRKLPEIGKTLGKGLQEFKKASNELKRTWEEEVQLEKEREAVGSILKETKDEIQKTASDFANTITQESSDGYPDLPSGTFEAAPEVAKETPEASPEVAEEASQVSQDIAKNTSEIANEMK
jgi:sec-independent protein translocase protein TatA